jgi:putative copper resistance protein D
VGTASRRHGGVLILRSGERCTIARVTPLQPADLLTAWTASPLGLVLVVLAVATYSTWLVRARRAGARWSWGRVALYFGFGVGTLAYAVCGPLAVYRAQVFWVGAVQVGVLASVTPVGLALGDPVGLLRATRPERRHWLVRALEGPVVRALMYPGVSTLLAVGTVLLVFFTPWFERASHGGAPEGLLYVVLLGTGLLFVLPLLVGELLPAWATPPVRVFLAFLDGLLDAVPGLLVMTSSTLLAPGFPGFSSHVSGLAAALDQRLGGAALVAVAESVGIPVIAAVVIEWIRTDDREARAVDARLDAESTGSPAATAAGTPDGASSGLWWESDPRFAGRYGRHP